MEMEAFFASHNMATPSRFSQLEHYLAVVSNFWRPAVSVNWEVSFRKWQRERREKSDKGSVVGEVETGITLTIPNVNIPQMDSPDKEKNEKGISRLACCSCAKIKELVRRYMLHMLSTLPRHFASRCRSVPCKRRLIGSFFLGAMYWQFEKTTRIIIRLNLLQH